MCEALLHKAKSEYLDIVNCYLRKTVKGVDDMKDKYNMGYYCSPEEAVRKLLHRTDSGVAWGRLYRKSLFIENAIEFPAILHEDLPVIFLLYLYAQTVGTVKEYFCHWVQRSGSIINQGLTIKHINDFFIAMDLREKFLKDNHIWWDKYKADHYFGLFTTISAIALELRKDKSQTRQEKAKQLLLNILQRDLHSTEVHNNLGVKQTVRIFHALGKMLTPLLSDEFIYKYYKGI
jgi:hypothetical protein